MPNRSKPTLPTAMRIEAPAAAPPLGVQELAPAFDAQRLASGLAQLGLRSRAATQVLDALQLASRDSVADPFTVAALKLTSLDVLRSAGVPGVAALRVLAPDLVLYTVADEYYDPPDNKQLKKRTRIEPGDDDEHPKSITTEQYDQQGRLTGRHTTTYGENGKKTEKDETFNPPVGPGAKDPTPSSSWTEEWEGGKPVRKRDVVYGGKPPCRVERLWEPPEKEKEEKRVVGEGPDKDKDGKLKEHGTTTTFAPDGSVEKVTQF